MSHDYEVSIRYIELRRYTEARETLQNALQANPNNSEILSLLATTYLFESDIEGYLEKGTEVAQRGLTIDPDHESLRYTLFQLLEEKQDYQDAEKVIIELIRDFPKDPEYIAAYARLMLFTFNLAKARLLCDEALRLAPDHANARIMDVLITIANGDVKHAEQNLAQLVQEFPDSEHIMHLLLIALCNRKQYKAAFYLTQELLKSNPYDQNLVELIVELRAHTHWTAWPLWPFIRFGWPAVFFFWVVAIVFSQLVNTYNISWGGYFLYPYLAYCIYSWVHGPILKRWINFRGV